MCVGSLSLIHAGRSNGSEVMEYHGPKLNRAHTTQERPSNQNKIIGSVSLIEERHVGRLQSPEPCVLAFCEFLQIEKSKTHSGIIGFVSSRRS